MDSPQAAIRESLRLVERSMRLTEPPLLGHRMREYPNDEVHELLERPYRLIYLLDGDTIVIITVMHYRQQLPLKAADLRRV